MERANAVTNECDVNPLGVLAPRPAFELVLGDAFGDDEAFDVRVDLVDLFCDFEDARGID